MSTGTVTNVVSNACFLHPHGRENVRWHLDDLLRSATSRLRAAVCFFTEPGFIILRPHAAHLRIPGSFFIASVDFPTNIDALERLHRLAPGNVYIHLGGATPEEYGVGRSLMHSKLFLAENEIDCGLWVGSHNLTAMAMEGGNFEAGITFDIAPSSQVFLDAASHLEACRTTAEVFDPAQKLRYKEIQRRRCGQSDWDVEKFVLVIHAEADERPANSSFIAHVLLQPTEFDRPGSLRPGVPVNYDEAELWTGAITAVVRTEHHPRHRGTRGQFEDADYDIDVSSLNSIPRLGPPGQSGIRPCTQVVIRLDGRGELGGELYCVGKSPLINVLDASPPLELHEVDHDVSRFFTEESLDGFRLQYRAAVGMRKDVVVDGYQETYRSFKSEQLPAKLARDDVERISYEAREPKRTIDPYFYLSSYAIRPKREIDERH